MYKVTLIIFDSSNYSLEDLLSLTNIESSFVNKYKQLETKKEKLISEYFKRKYVPSYYLSETNKPLSKDIKFNISHSHGIICLVLSESIDIGVDIELIRKKEDRLKEYISSPSELDYINSDINFYEVWTSKESLVKCIGSGLVNNIKEIPSLPINGKKYYLGESYISKCIHLDNSIISITLKGEDDFKVDFLKEKFN